ncbi:hypothetical protein HDU87_003268 [Geranomyces variabilis]|uniref:Uncharacterized protein n=1 Tax=Geranomyces variabilis TaxID=109894 RepID=A0AAD5XQS5_9FUNG|nr:hypothetical protein HDU87_003268 [Geranomyces variabilis]
MASSPSPPAQPPAPQPPQPPPLLADASSSAGQTQSITYIAPILGICSVLGLFAILLAFFLWRRHVRRRPGYSQRSFQRKHGFSVVACRIRQMWGVPDHSDHHLSDELTPPAHNGEAPRHGAIDTSSSSSTPEMAAATTRPHSGSSSPRSARKSPSQLPLVNTTTAAAAGAGAHRLSANSLASLGSPPSSPSSPIAAVRPSGPCFRPSSEMLPTRLCKTYVWQQEPSPLAYEHGSGQYGGHEDLACPTIPTARPPTEEVRSAKSIRMGWDEDETLV